MSGALRRGGRLGKYRLEKRLGEGGSAVVWQARDTIEGRRVAVKVVLDEVVREFGRAAVEREARTAAQLDHPCVAGIRNADWIDSRFVLVTDLASTSLDRYTGVRRSSAVALSILSDVAEGLAYAHGLGLIHRDVKPANIFIYEGRRAKLGDFGTARLAPAATRAATEVGTFGYMAPEQAYGRTKPASDVFSLALTGYEMFAGALPGWPFEWPLEGGQRFERRCPARVARVIRRGLEVDLRRRWPDAGEFHSALRQAIEREEAERAPKRGRAGGRSKRRATAPADPFILEQQWFRRHYGATFEAVFDCHACEGPIGESMSWCPWCGSDRNSFAEVTTHALVCPECERGVRPEWRACPTCSKGRFESNGRAIRPDPHAERRCSRKACGAPLKRFMKYCPACKQKVARPWKVEGLGACSRCRWPLAGRWRFCAWCGKRNDRALDVSLAGGRRNA